MIFRFDIINFLLKKYFNSEARYLEIGVADPTVCFNKIRCNNKTSVDPNKYIPSDFINYKITSDEFFQELENSNLEFPADYKWDIIFIDGLHLAEQVHKDIFNSIRHCNPNGFIVLHDCNPENWFNAYSDIEYFLNDPGEWNGTTWKAFYNFRVTMPIKSYTVDTDYGVGVIELNKQQQQIQHTNTWYEFGHFKYNRKEQVGLISVDEFYNMHK
jgi:hypothetical protein